MVGRFINMVEKMLGSGKFQIAGEAETFETKAEVDAALFERGFRMETVWFPAEEVTDAPDWASKVYHLRTIEGHRRAGDQHLVFAE